MRDQMSMLKKIALVALAVAAVGGFRMAAQQANRLPSGTPVAYVSAQRILQESPAGKAQLAKMQAFQQQRTAELRTRQQTLEATRRDLAAATDPARRTTLAQQEQVQRSDLERATAQTQVDLQTLQRQVNADLQKDVRGVLDQMLKSSTIRVVLNTDNAMVWGNPSDDITTAVIERMNLNASLGPKS